MKIILRIPRRGLPRAGLTAGAVAVVAAVTVAAQGAPPPVDTTVEPAMQEAASPSLAAAPRDAFLLTPVTGDPGPAATPGEPGADGSAPVPVTGSRPGETSPARGGPSSRAVAVQEAQPQQGGQPQEGEAQQPEAGQGDVGPIMSAGEEAAMRLIRQILQEEEGVRMGQDFSYQSAGRRDPFRSLLQQAASQVAAPQVRPPGLPGFLVSEVEVKAIARYQGGWAALLLAPDQKSYFAEVGTELYDGHIRQIRTNEVVFEQRVSDLLGARRTREVVKTLREIGGGSESRP